MENRTFRGIVLWFGRQYEKGLVKTFIDKDAIRTPIENINRTRAEKPRCLFVVIAWIIVIIMTNPKAPKTNPNNQELIL